MKQTGYDWYLIWKENRVKYDSNNTARKIVSIFSNRRFPGSSVARNPNITIEDVLKNPKKYSANKLELSMHPNILIEDILKYPNFKWDWEGVLRNPNLTLKTVLKYPQKNWDWKAISRNNFLENDIVYKNNLKSDIKTRREKITKLSLFGRLETLVIKYVGYF